MNIFITRYYHLLIPIMANQQPVNVPAPVLAPGPAAVRQRRVSPQYTPEQRLFVYNLKQRRNTYQQIRVLWQQTYNIPPPSRKSIYNIEQKVNTHHTFLNINAGNSGRPLTERTDDNILIVMGDILETPRLGLRKRGPKIGMTKSSLQRILKNDLKCKPYHLTVHQQLHLQDPQTRMDFSRWFLAQQMADPEFEDRIWWTDEAHCHLDGYVNSHNAIHWGSQRPASVIQKPLHPLKVTVWCGISSRGILGPFFFEENGRTVTVNGTRYLDMLENQFYPELSNLTFNNTQIQWTDYPEWWYMQDGAPAHTTVRARNYLADKFDTRTIGYRLANHWPARSPDMTPCDFFLWGYVKDELYKRYPLTGRHHLKTEITDIIQNMDQNFVTNACRSVQKRCVSLLAAQGEHFEQFR